jgi:hypothetical protein
VMQPSLGFFNLLVACTTWFCEKPAPDDAFGVVSIRSDPSRGRRPSAPMGLKKNTKRAKRAKEVHDLMLPLNML